MTRFSKPKFHSKFHLPHITVPAPIARLWSRFFRGTRKVVAIGAAVVIIIVLPVIIWQLHSPTQKVDAAWFDANYGYRKKIPISNSGTAQTDFQVQVTVDTATLITANKMLSSCNDIRLTDIAGKSLSYWIEPGTCNTASTLIWVKVPSISTTGADIYIYYGNASATAASATTPTFIRDMGSAAAAWPLDETLSTQSYSRDINPALATGRNLTVDPGFDDATKWTPGTGWAITGSQAVGTSVAPATTLVQTSPMVVGRLYQVTFTLVATSGSLHFQSGSGSQGTVRSTSGTFTQTLFCQTNINQLAFVVDTTFTGTIDNVIVTEINVPASPAIAATNLIADGTMEAGTTAAWTSAGSATLTKQSTNPHGGTQFLRVVRNGATSGGANQTVFTIGTTYRISGYARSDGTSIPVIRDGGGVSIYSGGTVATTVWQVIDFSYVATTTDIRLSGNSGVNGTYTEFDDFTVTADTVLRPGELLPDGNMEFVDSPTSWTTGDINHYWTPGASAGTTISKQTGTPHGGAQVLRVANTAGNVSVTNQILFVTGKTYRITGWARSDGNATPKITSPATLFTGTTSTSWQSIDVTTTAANATLSLNVTPTGSNQYVEFDDMSVTEISPMSGIPTNGVVLGTSAGVTHLSNAYTFDGTNDNVNVYSGTLTSVFNPSEGTLVTWAKVSGAGVWSDASVRYIDRFTVDANNQIQIQKGTTTNQLGFTYIAGSTSSQILTTSLGASTNWFQVVFTWSKSSDQVKAYINGAQVGSTQTGLGTWVGNFSSTGAVIGASVPAGTTPWSGLLNDTRLYTRALSAAEISDQYNASYDTQNYYTTNYVGRELIRKYSSSVTVGALASEETTPGAGLYWSMEEGQGTTAHDVTLQANSGTLGGTTPPTWQTPDLCALGRCLYFDGVTSKVTGSKISTNLQTVGFWIKPNKAEGLGIFNLDGGTHKISSNTSGVITATGWTSPTYYINGLATTTPTLTAGAWNYVEITTATGFNTTNNFTLGTDGTTFTQGYVDEVKFFPYARTAAQAKVDYDSVGANLGQFSQKNQQVSGLIAQWPLDDTTATQSYDRVVNPGITTGRNVVLNGTFTDSSTWVLGTNATISGGTLNITSGSSSLTTQSPDIVIGRAYTINYTILNYSAGNLLMELGATGTSRSTNGTFSDTLIATSTTFTIFGNSSFVGSVDNVTITELNIPTSPATQPTQLLADGDMEAAGTGAWTAQNGATLTKQSTNPHSGSQLLRIAGNATSDAIQNVLTSGQVYRVYGYARSDGTGVPKVTAGGVTVFTGTNSTSWQPFDGIVVAGSNVLALLDNTNSTYIEFDDVVAAPDTFIRSGELLVDGNMETSGTSYWTAGNSATLTKDTGSPHGGTQNLRVARSTVNNPTATAVQTFPLGKYARITGWARSDGNAIPSVRAIGTTGFTGTTSTSWQFFDFFTSADSAGTLILTATTSTGTQYAEFDDLSITEMAPLVARPANGVVLGASTGAGGHGQTAASFDGTNDYITPYSGSLNSALNVNEGTLIAWVKVSGSGVWTDGSLRRVFYTSPDAGNNNISLYKSNSNNSLGFAYSAGAVGRTVSFASSSTGWIQLTVTWSKTNDEVKAYYNGAQAGSTLNGLGTWSGNLVSSSTVIGNGSTSPANQPWSGLINDVRLYNRALTASEIASLYGTGTAGGPSAYWKLDDATGTTAIDSSGNNNTGTLTNGPTWVTGQVGRAVNFDGSNDYITAPDSATLSPAANDFSVGTWFKTSASYGGGQGDLFSDIGSTTNNKVSLFITTSNTLSCVYQDGSANAATATSAGTVNDGVWHYASCVRNGTTANLYLDGVLSATNTNASLGTIDTSGRAKTLATSSTSAGSSENFTGLLDDVKVYRYARSLAQALEDMGGSTGGAEGGLSVGALPKPIGWWKFDEGNGTTANNAGVGGSALNGTLTGMATAPSTSTSGWNLVGKIGKSLIFDGFNGAASDYVTMGTNAALAVNGPFTISAWVYPTSFSGASAPANDIIGRYDNASSARNYELYTDSTGQLIFETSTNGSCASGGAVLLSTGKTLATGTWAYVAGVYDGTKMHAYINGVEVGTAVAQSSICTASTPFIVGGRFGGGALYQQGGWAGGIDNPKFYNVGLSAAQIQQDMLASASIDVGATAAQESSLLSDGTGTAPIGDWLFDERTGSSAKDISGQGNTATLNGSFNFNSASGWGPGKYGSAVQMDGVDDVIQSASTTYNLVGAGNFTVEAWVKPTTLSNSVNSRILTEKTDASNGYHLAIINSASGTCASRFIFEVDKATTYTASGCSTSNPAAVAGTWYHLTGVFNGTSNIPTLYVNGIAQVAGSTQSLGLGVTGTLTWGSQSTAGTNLFNGEIDETKVYNYARTQAQIMYDYNRGGPIAWYKMDECQGSTLNDASGNAANAGTITIGAGGSQAIVGTCNTASSAWGNGAVGKYNSSLKFDGTDDYATVTGSGTTVPATFSYSVWVKPAVSLGNANYEVMGKISGGCGSSVSQGWIQIRNNIASFFIPNTVGNCSAAEADSTSLVSAGNWYHIVGTFDGTTAKIYFNGQLQGSGALTGTFVTNPSGSFIIGNYLNTNFFNGQIDDVRVYNYTLSQAQINEIYNGGAAVRFAPNTGSP